MNRRTALFSTMLLGGLLPRRLVGQQRSDRFTPVDRPADLDEPDFEPSPSGAEDFQRFGSPSDFPRLQPGHGWGIFPIESYTSLPHSKDTTNPESALIDWVFRYTGSSAWHGQEIAVLNATPNRLMAFHNRERIEQVAEVWKRFVDAYIDIFSLRVRIVAAADPNWRYPIFSQLEHKDTGPQGQQVWTLDLGTAEMVLAQMGINQSFRKELDEKHDIVNGQTLYFKRAFNRDYVSGLNRASAAGLGFEQKFGKLEEGVELRISPLLNYDGNAIDLAVDLKANTIRRLYQAKVIAPRRVGTPEMNIDVPEVTQTRLNKTISNWPLDKTLLISSGIHPGILADKNGWLNLRIPGTMPTTTELLIFIEVNTRLSAARSDRERR